MDYQQLAQLLFGNLAHDIDDYEQLYPPRKLAAQALVTRIGPSPTGFIHLGNLYNAIIGERLAHQSNGVFFLRIEDTDHKREVAGAVEMILSALGFFGVHFDEGATVDGDQGAYGPYRQRQRKEIYQAVAKKLVLQGQAYPCFATEQELETMRQEQISLKVNFGYYGKWAKYRDLELAEIAQRLAAGESYVLRFRAQEYADKTITIFDGIRGELNLQENYQDFVLLKSDGIPTYHFAHVVDDHFMRTTHVVRGEEWLATAPMHAAIFDALNWPRPIYCHTAQLMKLDGEIKRKLSKRKDPELALSYYQQQGYLPTAVWEYLLTVLNSNFEEWRLTNPETNLRDFHFSLEKMSTSGALFDLVKLSDISKEVLIKMDSTAIYNQLLTWAQQYDAQFAQLLESDPTYAKTIIDVGREGDRPRKDLVCWQQARDFLSFYYSQLFRREDQLPDNITPELRRQILSRYLDSL
ncbi:MAG: glutamate--tRNA ligase family protein, partial [Clostridiales bacterium]